MKEFGARKKGRNPGEVVGVIPDLHIPYHNRKYLLFVQRIFEEQGVNRVIQLGDLVDNHALSFHDSEPSLKGSKGELVDARKHLRPYFEAFPDVEVLTGNHDHIPGRQLKKVGLDPEEYLRPLPVVYDFPKGWTVHERIFSNGVLYHHGMTSMGVAGYLKDAQNRGMNTVSGHAHGNFGVSYSANEHRLVWGLGAGCGIDVKSMAFAYGKDFKQKPILGCAVIHENGRLPVCFPMNLGEKW